MDRMRWLLIALRFVVPLFVTAILFMGRLIITSVLAFWTGVPEAVRRMVHNWMVAAWNANVPTEYDTILHWLFTIVAYIMIILGWVGTAHLTVLFVAWIL